MYSTGGKQSCTGQYIHPRADYIAKILPIQLHALSLTREQEEYLQMLEHSQHDLNCEVVVVVELSAVNHHHGALSVCSQTSYLRLESVAASYCLGIGDFVGISVLFWSIPSMMRLRYFEENFSDLRRCFAYFSRSLLQ